MGYGIWDTAVPGVAFTFLPIEKNNSINILGGAVMSHDEHTWSGRTRDAKSD